MAGTDRSSTDNTDLQFMPDGPPAVILVRPQLGENIGMCARAMMNCGLTDLRLVAPRDGWPNEKSHASASGADSILDAARVFETTAEAVANLRFVLATTARPRDSAQRVLTPRDAATELHRAHADGIETGVIFGPESKGLANEDVAEADAILAVPLNPAFKSLNLAQAVFCIGYEWLQTGIDEAAWRETASTRESRPATKQELLGLFEHLESELDECGFLRPPEKRPAMVRNIRNMLHRAQLSEQETRTFRGMISGLTRRHLRGRDKG
ncbi:MAG: RNA methyltransferase [Rhodospirillales bacterium]